MRAQRRWMSVGVTVCAAWGASGAIVPMDGIWAPRATLVGLETQDSAGPGGLFADGRHRDCLLTVGHPVPPGVTMRDLAYAPATEAGGVCTGTVIGVSGPVTEPDPEAFGPLGGVRSGGAIERAQQSPLPGVEAITPG